MFRDNRGIAPLLTVICALAIAVPALAQEPSEAEMAAMMAAGQPGEHHQHEAFMEGSWDVALTMWMPGAPAPMNTEGAATFTTILDGRYMQQSYTGDFMGMEFEGLGTSGYDNIGKQHITTWTDNTSTTPILDTGQCSDGGTTIEWQGSVPDPATGSMVTTRTEQVKESDDKFTLISYSVDADGEETPMMKLVYTRK